MAKAETGYAVDPSHPRRAEGLVGHARAWVAFTSSLAAARMPHAWLLVGPRGVGKATFAYRAAVEILAKGGAAQGRPDTTGQSVRRRVAAGSHGDLLAVERDLDGGGTQGIPVAAVRDLRNYFALTSAEAGWRVAIVDALDDLNLHGVNALLKVVEEPPPRALLFLVAHRAGAVPATIRSRCRRLPFAGLAPDECVQVLERLLPDQSAAERSGLAHLANGAPGLAFAFAEADALALFGEITGLCRALPALDVPAVHAFSERFARQPGLRAFFDVCRHVQDLGVPDDRPHRGGRFGGRCGHRGWGRRGAAPVQRRGGPCGGALLVERCRPDCGRCDSRSPRPQTSRTGCLVRKPPTGARRLSRG